MIRFVCSRCQMRLSLEYAGIIVIRIGARYGAVATTTVHNIAGRTLLFQHLGIAIIRMSATLQHLIVGIIVGLLGIIIVGRRLQLLIARIVAVRRLTRWAVYSLVVLCAGAGRNRFDLNAAAAADIVVMRLTDSCYNRYNKGSY